MARALIISAAPGHNPAPRHMNQAPATHPATERVLGHVTGTPDGPVLVVVGSLHGNEPAGVAAIRRVLATIFEQQLQLQGELVAMVGNMAALAAGKRYLAHDLNRLWLADRIAVLRRRHPSQIDAEDREQLALLAEIESVRDPQRAPRSRPRPAHHVGRRLPLRRRLRQLENRDFAAAFPVPVILGLEEESRAPMLDHLGNGGWTTFAFEGGQHDDPVSVDCAEAAIWLALEATGVLAPGDRRFADAGRATLRRRTAGLPQVFEVCHHHRIRHGDAYVTEPGFASFQPIARGSSSPATVTAKCVRRTTAAS